MAWKAKLTAVDKTGVTVQYYETVSGEARDEKYGVGQFSTKAELVAYCKDVINTLKAQDTAATQMNTALGAFINQDIA